MFISDYYLFFYLLLSYETLSFILCLYSLFFILLRGS